MNYRHLERQKTPYFGSWPDVGTSDARELRDAARKKIVSGLDPAAEQKVERITRTIAEDNTSKKIAAEGRAKNERDEREAVKPGKNRRIINIAKTIIGRPTIPHTDKRR